MSLGLSRRLRYTVPALLASAALMTGFVLTSSAAEPATRQAAPCARPTGPPPGNSTPTTTDVLEQAYHCVLDHYYSGPVLDDRTLLTAAFVGFTQEIQRHGLDLGDAAMPAFTGDHDRDWATFRARYERLTAQLPNDGRLRQAVAAATMNGMIGSLGDNHARWMWLQRPDNAPPNTMYGIGIVAVSGEHGPDADPVATEPLYVLGVAPGSPADRQGIRAGDVIATVNDSAPYVAGVLSPGVLNLLNQHYPQADEVRVTLRRPADGRVRTVTLRPVIHPATPPEVTSKLIGDVGYVSLPGFMGGAADRVLAAIADLRSKNPRMRGVVLDLRDNGGGSPDEVNRLLATFVHGKTTAYLCDVKGACDESRTDDSVPLLNLKLVTLTNRRCASACEHFSGAVKDLGVGPLVGTRTAGVVSGPGSPWLLADNSVVTLPERHHLAPDHEQIDRVGVPPDHYVPQTAKDLSTGRDPALDKAVGLV